MSKIFGLMGKLVIALAGMALITGVSLFVVGGFLTTYPIMRMSPRNRQLQAGMEFARAAMQAYQVYIGGQIQ